MKQEIDTIKRRYVKPASMTIELRHRGMLLTGSQGMQSMRNGYGKANDGVDEEQLDDNGMWNWN